MCFLRLRGGSLATKTSLSKSRSSTATRTSINQTNSLTRAVVDFDPESYISYRMNYDIQSGFTMYSFHLVVAVSLEKHGCSQKLPCFPTETPQKATVQGSPPQPYIFFFVLFHDSYPGQLQREKWGLGRQRRERVSLNLPGSKVCILVGLFTTLDGIYSLRKLVHNLVKMAKDRIINKASVSNSVRYNFFCNYSNGWTKPRRMPSSVTRLQWADGPGKKDRGWGRGRGT